MVAARLTGCFSREDIRRVVSLRYGIDPARRQPAPLRQCPVRRAFSDPALPQGGPRLGLFLILLAGSFGNALNAWYRPAGISASASPRPFSARWACFPDSWPFKDGAAERRAIPESSPGAEASSCWPQARASSPCSARKATKRITPHTCSGALRLHRRWSLRLDITAYGPLSVINTLLGLSAAGLVVLCWRLAL